MGGSYIIENGEIKLLLSEADFAEVLDDVSQCRDLLEPQIRIIDNTVIFRDHDIKLIDPELFFRKNVPEFKPSKEFVRNWLILIFLLLFFSLGVGLMLENGLGVTLITIAGLAVGVVLSLFHFAILRNEYHKRHRDALYARAKLLSFFYMNILEELTVTADRLERSQQRLNKEYVDLKESFRDMYSILTNEQKAKFRSSFPDGDTIEEKKNINLKYH